MENNNIKRELVQEKKQGLTLSDLILTAVLLAAGAVLKYAAGSIINIGGMKPNFIIAMYCAAIVLIRPRMREAAVIGILAGAICQFFPGTPYINLISETLGALAMAALIRPPLKVGKIDLRPSVCTFISTIVSGGTFVIMLITFALGAGSAVMAAYVPIVLGTAAINTVIVQLIYIPLSFATKKAARE